MATNGDSARKWLSDNKQKVSEVRVKQIRDSLENKANELSNAESDDLDDEYQGVLEALEVMEEFLATHFKSTFKSASRTSEASAEHSTPDYSSLVSDAPADAPQLDENEKRARFQDLLKKSKF